MATASNPHSNVQRLDVMNECLNVLHSFTANKKNKYRCKDLCIHSAVAQNSPQSNIAYDNGVVSTKGEAHKGSQHLIYITSLSPHPSSSFFPLAHLTLLPVPPAIMLETIQVNETSDIISWQPPAEPNGQILHYNIRIYRVDGDGNQVLVDIVRGVQGTTFDFSTRELNTGTYNIQVGCPCELLCNVYQKV